MMLKVRGIEVGSMLYKLRTSAVHCSVLLCSTVQCSAVQCIVMQYSAVQWSAVYCYAVQCSAVQCSAVYCYAVQCSGVQCRAVYCYAVQCSVVQYRAFNFQWRTVSMVTHHVLCPDQGFEVVFPIFISTLSELDRLYSHWILLIPSGRKANITAPSQHKLKPKWAVMLMSCHVHEIIFCKDKSCYKKATCPQ